MKVTRRRALAPLLAAGSVAGPAQQPAPSLDALRHVANAHGLTLSDDRLRLLQPVLENRKTQLNALRALAIDDAVAPTQGILGA